MIMMQMCHASQWDHLWDSRSENDNLCDHEISSFWVHQHNQLMLAGYAIDIDTEQQRDATYDETTHLRMCMTQEKKKKNEQRISLTRTRWRTMARLGLHGADNKAKTQQLRWWAILSQRCLHFAFLHFLGHSLLRLKTVYIENSLASAQFGVAKLSVRVCVDRRQTKEEIITGATSA